MRKLLNIWLASALAFTIAIAACPGPTTGGVDGTTTGDTPGGEITGDGIGGDSVNVPDEGPGPTGWTSGDESNAWRIIFNYRGRVPNTPDYGTNDLWLMTPFGTEKLRITELADLPNQDPPLSCAYGCFVDPALKWLAITDGPPDANGFDFRLGQFTNDDLDFQLIKDLVLTDKIDFKFADDRLYFSELNSCVGPSCQYDISFIDLKTNAINKILTYPLGDDLEQSNYKGHFKVSPDGRKLIMLNTTIRSVQVSMWKDGTGLVQLDFICKFGTQGNCQGTGSEYQDVDPVAISHDNQYAVFFTFSDRWQRARIYDLENPGDVQMAVLAEVPVGSYIEHACDFGTLQDWQWQRVVGDPYFTPNNEEVVFLTETDCPAPNGSKPKKARRNLVRVKLATLLSGKNIDEDDLYFITQNPPMGADLGDNRDNLFVTGFEVAPDGQTIVFSGTPYFDQSGEPMNDSSSRHRNDREIFRTRLDAGLPQWNVPSSVRCDRGLCQLTNDPSWEAQSPRAVPPKPAP